MVVAGPVVRFLGGVSWRVARPALAAFLLSLAGSPRAQANPISDENALPGNPPSEWDVVGDGDPSIQGFATEMSVDQGQTIEFKVDTPATDYRIDIYRLGWYGGLGARYVATVQPSATLPQTQPPCVVDTATRLTDCGTWATSASWTVPIHAVSGIYVAKLVREDPEDGRASHIVFVVRDDNGRSDLLFQTSDTTWQAYNHYVGASLYSRVRAYKVSYNRPMVLRQAEPWDWVFNAEYPMLRWLERNGYDLSYCAGVDTDRRGAELLEHRVFLSVGHDEYWSRGQRDAVAAARDAGVHLAFFSGNEIYWKTRWEPSIDGTTTPYRTLVCYKETYSGIKLDPLPNVWTGQWRDCRFTPPADGCEPENELSGQISWSVAICGTSTCGIQVPDAYSRMRLWRSTDIATLAPGQVASFPAGTLGFEWDYKQFESSYPPGLVWLSSTTAGGLTHHLSLYRHPSGALVFGAGTIQWAWGLDDVHTQAHLPPIAGEPPDARMQQVTVNVLAEMGAQPATLQSGLVPASPTPDAVPPVSQIVSPGLGASLLSGLVQIHGTASDASGVVGVVEVSVDGGTTWARAEGRESWTYDWMAPAHTQATLRCRAADDLGNLEQPGPGIVVTLGGPPLEIASLGVDANAYQNGVDAAHLSVVTRSNGDAADSLLLHVTLTSNLGDTFDLGTATFGLSPQAEHASFFTWPVPAAPHPWEFAMRAELFRGGTPVGVSSRPAAFTGMVMTHPELQQAVDGLVGTTGCLVPPASCDSATVGAVPHFGAFAGWGPAHDVLCQARVELQADRLLAAGVRGLAAFLGPVEVVLDALPSARLRADALPSAVASAIACDEARVALGLGVAASKPTTAPELDSLAATVASGFAAAGRPYSNEVFVEGPVEMRLGVYGHWTSKTSLDLRNAFVFDVGGAGVEWGHLGTEPLPLAPGSTNPHATAAVELRASGPGTLEYRLLHRTAQDSIVWLPYDPIPVTASTVVRTFLSDDLLYPWGMGLFVDREGDGGTDEIVYPNGMIPSDVEVASGLQFRLLPAQPNPFEPSTTIRYVLPAPGRVTVTLYDVRGRAVRTLFAGVQGAGFRSLGWDGRTEDGSRLASGTYVLRVATPWGSATRKLTLLR